MIGKKVIVVFISIYTHNIRDTLPTGLPLETSVAAPADATVVTLLIPIH